MLCFGTDVGCFWKKLYQTRIQNNCKLMWNWQTTFYGFGDEQGKKQKPWSSRLVFLFDSCLNPKPTDRLVTMSNDQVDLSCTLIVFTEDFLNVGLECLVKRCRLSKARSIAPLGPLVMSLTSDQVIVSDLSTLTSVTFTSQFSSLFSLLLLYLLNHQTAKTEVISQFRSFVYARWLSCNHVIVID